MDLKNKVLRTNRTQGAHSYNAEMRRVFLDCAKCGDASSSRSRSTVAGSVLAVRKQDAHSYNAEMRRLLLILLNAEIRAVQGVARTPPRAY